MIRSRTHRHWIAIINEPQLFSCLGLSYSIRCNEIQTLLLLLRVLHSGERSLLIIGRRYWFNEKKKRLLLFILAEDILSRRGKRWLTFDRPSQEESVRRTTRRQVQYLWCWKRALRTHVAKMGEGITCPLRRRSSRESVVLRATVAETRIFALVSYEGKVGRRITPYVGLIHVEAYVERRCARI